jgi:hypothetical protein
MEMDFGPEYRLPEPIWQASLTLNELDRKLREDLAPSVKMVNETRRRVWLANLENRHLSRV